MDKNNIGFKKVCYVGSPPLFTKGASSIHVMKMCQAMRKLGIEVELVLPDHFRKADIYEYYGITEKFDIKFIPSTNLPGRQVIHGIFASFYAYKHRKKFDVFLTRNIVFTYIVTVFMGLKTIYDAHHPLVNRIAHYMFGSFCKSDHLLRVSTNSGGLAEIYIKEGLDPGKIVVAHNGVELEKFESGKNRNLLRNELGLDRDRKIVCYCGNTYKGRGIEYMVEIAGMMSDITFLIIGGLDNDNEYYADLAKRKGAENFIIRGYVPHDTVSLYLLASDVLVIPYTSQMTIKGGTNAAAFTSPIKLFEYMAAGKPIVATSLPTVKEILTDGVDSLLVDPDSPDTLYNGIELVLNNSKLSEKLSQNALSKVRDYTWEKRVEKILGNL